MSTCLEDCVFAISGKLTVTQAEFKSLITDNGGSVAGSVTKKCTHLVSVKDDEGSDKWAKAKAANLPIVTENYVRECIKAGKKLEEKDFLVEAAAAAAPAPVEGAAAPAPAAAAAAAPAPAPAPVEESKKRVAEEVAEGEKETKKQKETADDSDSEPEQKAKIIVKGRAAVDSVVPGAANKIVVDEGDTVWDCMLNQTNISGNNNKFYVIQLLKDERTDSYEVWNRWGRVGERGQNKLMPMGNNLNRAKQEFAKKFRDKTKNDWHNSKHFKAVAGKYTMIEIDYGADSVADLKRQKKAEAKAAGGAAAAAVEKKESKLDERLQALIKMIFDMKMMERAMTELEFDVRKMPLGKLTKEQIKRGYTVLKELEAEMAKAKPSRSTLEQLTSQFYTLIPHNFGRMRPPVIDQGETLRKKMQMLEALADIEIAAKLIADTEENAAAGENPIDSNYRKLNASLDPVDQGTDEWEMIQRYVANTHPRQTPTIKAIFRLERAGEVARYEKSKNTMGNRMLLWHGSRLTNFVGILSQGLRIAPPEAPVSGYRFGKGIYFADICGLASRYCRAVGSDFLMLLGDVALGKTADLVRDTYMEQPQPGTDSTKALGTIEPDPTDRKVLPDGLVVPWGKIVDSPYKNVSCMEHQYITYSVSNVQLKYLIHFA